MLTIMNIHYKLTKQDMQTYGGAQWVMGEWQETNGNGGLCGPGWLHAYHSPELAVLLNPIHADIEQPRLFRCEGDGSLLDDHGLKLGRTRMRLIEEVPLPTVTTEQRVQFGILCALHVCNDGTWCQWARGWLDGTDRSRAAAYAAADAAYAARSRAAARAAADAAYAARAAAEAAAYAAARAAYAARAAAAAAEAAAADINLIEIAKGALS